MTHVQHRIKVSALLTVKTQVPPAAELVYWTCFRTLKLYFLFPVWQEHNSLVQCHPCSGLTNPALFVNISDIFCMFTVQFWIITLSQSTKLANTGVIWWPTTILLIMSWQNRTFEAQGPPPKELNTSGFLELKGTTRVKGCSKTLTENQGLIQT